MTDPIAPGTSGIPHIPRPYYAHFDHDPPGGDINLFLGTRGRGVWRLTFKKVDMPEISVPAPPTFEASCLGDSPHGSLKVCNPAPANLVIASITSSNPSSRSWLRRADSRSRSVTTSAFRSTSSSRQRRREPRTRRTLTITSNDPNFPVLHVAVTATVGQATAVTMIADTGNFGQLCPAPHASRIWRSPSTIAAPVRSSSPASHRRRRIFRSRRC